MSVKIEIKKMMRKIIEASGNKVHNRFANHVLNRPRLLHWQLHILVRVSHVRQLPISGRVQKKAWEFTFAYPVIRPWRAYQKDKQRSQPTPG